jgi:hypothetical protein
MQTAFAQICSFTGRFAEYQCFLPAARLPVASQKRGREQIYAQIRNEIMQTAPAIGQRHDPYET